MLMVVVVVKVTVVVELVQDPQSIGHKAVAVPPKSREVHSVFSRSMHPGGSTTPKQFGVEVDPVYVVFVVEVAVETVMVLTVVEVVLDAVVLLEVQLLHIAGHFLLVASPRVPFLTQNPTVKKVVHSSGSGAPLQSGVVVVTEVVDVVVSMHVPQSTGQRLPTNEMGVHTFRACSGVMNPHSSSGSGLPLHTGVVVMVVVDDKVVVLVAVAVVVLRVVTDVVVVVSVNVVAEVDVSVVAVMVELVAVIVVVEVVPVAVVLVVVHVPQSALQM